MNRSVLPANRCHDTMSGVSRIRRSSAIAGVLAAVFAAVALVSCGRGPADPAGVAVAEVGGRSVTLAQLQAYLATNLMTPEGAETLPAGEPIAVFYASDLAEPYEYKGIFYHARHSATVSEHLK